MGKFLRGAVVFLSITLTLAMVLPAQADWADHNIDNVVSEALKDGFMGSPASLERHMKNAWRAVVIRKLKGIERSQISTSRAISFEIQVPTHKLSPEVEFDNIISALRASSLPIHMTINILSNTQLPAAPSFKVSDPAGVLGARQLLQQAMSLGVPPALVIFNLTATSMADLRPLIHRIEVAAADEMQRQLQQVQLHPELMRWFTFVAMLPVGLTDRLIGIGQGNLALTLSPASEELAYEQLLSFAERLQFLNSLRTQHSIELDGYFSSPNFAPAVPFPAWPLSHILSNTFNVFDIVMNLSSLAQKNLGFAPRALSPQAEDVRMTSIKLSQGGQDFSSSSLQAFFDAKFKNTPYVDPLALDPSKTLFEEQNPFTPFYHNGQRSFILMAAMNNGSHPSLNAPNTNLANAQRSAAASPPAATAPARSGLQKKNGSYLNDIKMLENSNLAPLTGGKPAIQRDLPPDLYNMTSPLKERPLTPQDYAALAAVEDSKRLGQNADAPPMKDAFFEEFKKKFPDKFPKKECEKVLSPPEDN